MLWCRAKYSRVGPKNISRLLHKDCIPPPLPCGLVRASVLSSKSYFKEFFTSRVWAYLELFHGIAGVSI